MNQKSLIIGTRLLLSAFVAAALPLACSTETIGGAASTKAPPAEDAVNVGQAAPADSSVAGVDAPVSATALPAAQAADLQRQIDTQLRATPDATQIAANQIAWNDGKVVMSFPVANSYAATRCPAGWSCFFEHINFGGRMLRFSDCGYWQFFGDYGFRNQTSSWDNRLGRWVYVDNDDAGVRLWNESPNSQSSWVGNDKNDRADSLFISCN